MMLTATAKVETIQQNCDVTGEVNLGVKAKGFTQQVMQQKKKHVSSWMIQQQKHHVKNSSVYSSAVIF